MTVATVERTQTEKTMVSENERDQLTSAYRRDPVSVAGLLLTCAAGLLIVIALAVLGFDIHTYSGADTPAQTASQTP